MLSPLPALCIRPCHHNLSYCHDRACSLILTVLQNATFMCRFAAPLAFNFMAAIALPPGKGAAGGADVKQTAFYDQLGRLMLEQPLIGMPFTTYAPLLLLPVVTLVSCNFFNRCPPALPLDIT